MKSKHLTKILTIFFIMALFIGYGCKSNTSLPQSEKALEQVEATKAAQQVSSFGDNPGDLKMFLHVPSNVPANAPVVVALHGCNQNGKVIMGQPGETANATGHALAFETDSEWSVLADKFGFIVIYPEQTVRVTSISDSNKVNNDYACFNWAGFYGYNFGREQGESKSIKSMIDYVKSNYSVNNNRVYITGLSAGAGMTNTMLAHYPDVFAGGSIMAGLAYGCATYDGATGSTVKTRAFDCMGVDSSFSMKYDGMPENLKKSASEWAQITKNAYPDYTGSYPKVMIWQGEEDQYVTYEQFAEVTKQWTGVHGIDMTADNNGSKLKEGSDHAYEEYQDGSGNVLVARVSLPGMKHGISVDPGSGEDQGGACESGVSATGSCTGIIVMGARWAHGENGIYSSYYTAKFWGLMGPVDSPPAVTITQPTGSVAAGNITIAATATDDNGITKVEFYNGATLIDTVTAAPYEITWNAAIGTHSIKAVAYDTINQTGEDTKSVKACDGVCVDTPPAISITSPVNNATLNAGNITVTVNASDDEGVSKVELLVDGSVVKTSTAAPFSLTWSATQGTHTLAAKAYDTINQTTTSTSISVTVNQANYWPSQAITKMAQSSSDAHVHSYVPEGISQAGSASLVVALPGCNQYITSAGPSAGSKFLEETEFDKLADREKFFLVVADEHSQMQSCLDWWSGTAQGWVGNNFVEPAGDTAVIRNAINAMKSTYANIDKVYLFGFSAGAAQALILAARYPDEIDKVVVSAAVPYRGFTGSDFGTMGYIINISAQTPETLAGLIPSSSRSILPPLLVMHGTSDGTVKYGYHNEVMKQWTGAKGVDQTADETTDMHGHSYKKYKDGSGNLVVATVEINGMGHCISTDPGSGEEQGGEDAKGCSYSNKYFADDMNLYGPYEAWKFFTDGGTPPDNPPTVDITSPLAGSNVGEGNVTITATATDDNGVSRVEVIVDGTSLGNATKGSGNTYSIVWDASDAAQGNHTIVAKAYDTKNQTADDTVSVTGGGYVDTVPPTVNITAPSNGASIDEGNIVVSASANDNKGVTKVEFFANGSLIGTATSGYQITWNATPGNYTLTAKAYDAADNTAISSPITVTITESVFQCTTVTATNMEHVAAGRAQAGGLMDMYAIAVGSGNDLGLLGSEYYSAITTVSEAAENYFVKGECPTEDTEPPVNVAVTSPADGAEVVKGNVTIAASGSDNVGIVKYKFFVDNVEIGEAASQITWDASALTVGSSHTIKVQAFDAANNSAMSVEITVTIKDGSSQACYTDSNMNHNSAGRTDRISSMDYRAKGSGANLGWGITVTSLLETSSGYFEKVDSCD